jgi:hypothetical protein
MWVKIMGLSDFVPNKTPIFVAVVENAGKAPALNVLVQYRLMARPAPILKEMPPLTKMATPGSRSDVPPGGEINLYAELPVENQEGIMQFFRGGRIIYIYGIITYESYTGNRYRRSFCNVYKPSTTRFDVCSFRYEPE